MVTGSNSVAGFLAPTSGRKRPNQSPNCAGGNTRRISSASISDGDRNSSPAGSHAWQATSFRYQRSAVLTTSASSDSREVCRAKSCVSASANAMLKCVPTRSG